MLLSGIQWTLIYSVSIYKLVCNKNKFPTGEVEYTVDLVNIWGSGYCQSAQ